MKKMWIPVLILALVLGLSACGGSPGTVQPEMESAPSPESPAPLVEAPEDAAPEDTAEADPADPEEEHGPFDGDNILEHEPMGYCGNTVTKVSRDTRMGGEPWEVSFWGDDSVALTDLRCSWTTAGTSAGACRSTRWTRSSARATASTSPRATPATTEAR